MDSIPDKLEEDMERLPCRVTKEIIRRALMVSREGLKKGTDQKILEVQIADKVQNALNQILKQHGAPS